MGIVAAGYGQIQHVSVEVMVAGPAIVLGISHVQISRPATDGVAEFVQRPLGGPQTRGAPVAQRTALAKKVA